MTGTWKFRTPILTERKALKGEMTVVMRIPATAIIQIPMMVIIQVPERIRVMEPIHRAIRRMLKQERLQMEKKSLLPVSRQTVSLEAGMILIRQMFPLH